MNERIRELAGQVCDTLHDGDWNIPNEFIEKFAELIVRECIGCINNTDTDVIFTAHDAGVVAAAHRRSVQNIRQHFGVER